MTPDPARIAQLEREVAVDRVVSVIRGQDTGVRYIEVAVPISCGSSVRVKVWKDEVAHE